MSFKTRKEAQKRKIEVEHEIDTGTFIPPANIKIKDFLVDSVDLYGKRKWGLSMYTSNSGLIRNDINPILGEVNVQGMHTLDNGDTCEDRMSGNAFNRLPNG